MIEQQGQVVSVSAGRVSVRLGANAGCPACDAGRGCGAGVFGRLLRRKPIVLDFPDDLSCRAGQPVIVGLPENLLLRLVFRFYGFPLLAGLAGAALGHFLATSNGAAGAMVDGAALTGAIVAGLAVLVAVRRSGNEFPSVNAVHLLRHADQNPAPAMLDIKLDSDSNKR